MSNSSDSNSDDLRTFTAHLEVTEDGTWTGHVLDLPGCVAFGPCRDDTLQNLQPAVVDWHRWLREHGEPIEIPVISPHLDVAEIVEDVSPARKSGEAVALFTPDLEPVSDEDIQRTLTLQRYCQADVVELVAGQPASVQNARIAPGHRSVIEIVRHIGQAECWYLTRLELGDDDEIAVLYQRVTTGDPIDELSGVLAAAEERFQRWTPEQRTQRFVPQHNSRYGTEPWTARKVLRRFVEHRREHIDEIQRTIDAVAR